MQTYTHAVMGATIGAIFFRNNYLAQAACVAASVAPDLVMIPTYVRDKRAGRQPMTQQSETLMSLKEISHSLPLWMLCLAVVSVLFQSWRPVGEAFAAGGLAHIFIDVFTHGTGPKENRPYWDTDVKFMWPTPLDLRPLGVWEYRYDHGVRKPKPFEAAILVIYSITAIAAWVL